MGERNHRGRRQAEVAGEQVTLPVDHLAPNKWNYNVQSSGVFRKLVSAIKRHGFTKPVVVRQVAQASPGWEIVDGEHRWRAAKMLGMTQVPCVDLGAIPEARARELTLILNELSGQPDEARLGDVLRSISEVESQEELREVMPFADGELDAYLSAIDFSFTHLPEDDPTAGQSRAFQRGDESRRLVLNFMGQDAVELNEVALELGVSPADVVMGALRHKAGKAR